MPAIPKPGEGFRKQPPSRIVEGAVPGAVVSDRMNSFDDPQALARYPEGSPRLVPGFVDLHRMATLLLAEQAPA
jgi:hypothetical protein